VAFRGLTDYLKPVILRKWILLYNDGTNLVAGTQKYNRKTTILRFASSPWSKKNFHLLEWITRSGASKSI